MLFSKRSAVFIFLLIIKLQASTIKEIYSFQDAFEVLNTTTEKSLVLFDVDEVLIYPLDKIHLPKYFLVDPIKSFKKEFTYKLGDRVENVWSNVWLQAKRVLVEPEIIIDLIKLLQNKKVKVVGLTKLRVGRYGKIDLLQEYRFNQLLQLGIDFRPSYDKDIIFTRCEKKFNVYPIIYKGIIFSNDISKGDSLIEFISNLDYIPDKIIFFEDLIENLIDVKQKLEKFNTIEFHGYHYKGVENLSIGKINNDVAKFQLDYLSQNEVWLSEEEAYKLMQKV